MKRILYFSRESPFISESKDSLLNNTINDAQPINKKAVDSEGRNLFENQQEAVVVDSNGFVFLAEIDVPFEAKKQFTESQEIEDKQNLEQNNIQELVNSKVISHPVKQDVTASIKSVLLANKKVDEVQKQNRTHDNDALSAKKKADSTSENLTESIDSFAYIDTANEAELTSVNDLNSSTLEADDLSKRDKLFLELEALKDDVIYLDEEIVENMTEIRSFQDKETLDSPSEISYIETLEDHIHEKPIKESSLIESSLIESGLYNTISLNTTESLLKEVAENNVLSTKKEQLPENIVINIDTKKGDYSAPEHSELAYKTIDLSHSEVEKVDAQVIKAKNKHADSKNLIIKEVIRSTNKVSTHNVQKSENFLKSSLNLSDMESFKVKEAFDANKFFSEESQDLAYKGIVNFSESTIEESGVAEPEATNSFEKKSELPINSEAVSVDNEKVILSELDSKLDDQGIVFFAGVNSGLEEKSQKDSLDNVFSFESKILKGLGKKEKNISDQAEVKKEQNVSNKIKPLQLFDNVVKKLTSNHQQSNDEFLAQNNIDDAEHDISLERIRDTYQRIFSEYK